MNEHKCADCQETYYDVNMNEITSRYDAIVMWLCDECFEKYFPDRSSSYKGKSFSFRIVDSCDDTGTSQGG